jgi:hypothetical protein
VSTLRSGVARTTLATAAVTTLTATLLTASGSGTATAAPIKCNDTSTIDDPFYQGPPASDIYDKGRFSDSWRLPDLRTHIPQGTATWSNWQGEDDLILVTSYQDDKTEARVNAIDAKTGQHVGFADILGYDGKDQYSHVGGIAVFENKGWAYISGPGDGTVRKYSLAKLKEAITTTKEIKPESEEQIVHGNSFLTSHGPSNTLWAGQFFDSRRGDMRRYVVADNGDLEPQEGIWEVPRKTQGLVVTEDLFIYSTSHGRNNRSNIYVVRRGEGSSDLDTARMYCFRTPSMSEGLAVYGNDVYVAYESGAEFYSQASDKPDNVIEDLHKVPLAKLESLPPR